MICSKLFNNYGVFDMNLKKLITFILVFFVSFSVFSGTAFYGSSGNYLGKSISNSWGGNSYYGSSGNYLGKSQSNSWYSNSSGNYGSSLFN